MALLKVSVDEYHVGLVQLDSPETRNALSPEMKAELIAALERPRRRRSGCAAS